MSSDGRDAVERELTVMLQGQQKSFVPLDQQSIDEQLNELMNDARRLVDRIVALKERMAKYKALNDRFLGGLNEIPGK